MRSHGRHSHEHHAGINVHMTRPHQPAAMHGSLEAAAAAAAGGGGDDAADDDELAEFKREAAQLMQRAQPQQRLPAGLNPTTIASATKQLHSLGISKDDAETALLAMFEEHGANYDLWLNEAQVWLAIRDEADMEAAKMKEAMEVSLREQAEKRAADEAAAPPLVNLSEDRLRRKFAGSAVLPCLDRCMPSNVLFSDALPLRELIKFKLVALLHLESKCCKWYPDAATQQYFAAVGARCIEQLTSTRSSCSQIHLEALKAEEQQLTTGQRQQQLLQHREPSPKRAQSSTEQPSSAGRGMQQQQQQQQARRQAPVSNHMAAADRRCSLPLARDGEAAASVLPPRTAAGLAGATANDAAADYASVSEPAGHSPDAEHACGMKRSSRRRQVPSRYRSPSPGSSNITSGSNKASKGSRKRTPVLEEAALAAKAARIAGASSVASSMAPSLDRTAMPPPPARMSPGTSVSSAATAAAAPVITVSTMPTSLEGRQPSDVLLGQQQQQQSCHDQRLAALSSALGQHPAVIMQLSQMLEQEHNIVQEAVSAMPDTSGAVPELFQGTPNSLAEQDGSTSDLEIVEEVTASAAAANATGMWRPSSNAGEELESTAAVCSGPRQTAVAAVHGLPATTPLETAAGTSARSAGLATSLGLAHGVHMPHQLGSAVLPVQCSGHVHLLPAYQLLQQEKVLQQGLLQQQVTWQQAAVQQQAVQQQQAGQQAALQQHAAQQQLPDNRDTIFIDSD